MMMRKRKDLDGLTTHVSGLQYNNIYISMIFMSFMSFCFLSGTSTPFSFTLLLHIVCDK